MNRLTTRSKKAELNLKEDKTLEEEIYLKLAKFENEQEDKTLFTKGQLNMAVMKSVEMLAGVIKNKITKAILLALLTEIKPLEVDGKITYEQTEKTAFEIIKKVEETK